MKHWWKIGFVICTAIPLVAGLGYSLLYSFGLIGVLNNGFTIDHWSQIFSSGNFTRTVGYTLILVVIPMIVTPVIAAVIAYGWYKRKIAISKMFLVPMAMAPLVGAFSIYQWLSPSGFISRIVYKLGWIEALEDFPRWVNDEWSVSIFVTHIFLLLPVLTLFMFNVGIKERLHALEQTALGLGTTSFQFFMHVFLPIVSRKAAPILLLYGIFIFGTYEIPLLLGRQDPRVVTLFITDKLTRFNLQDIPQAHVMILLYAMLIGVFGILLIRKRSASW